MLSTYGELVKVDFDKAVCEIVELVLPRFTEYKVLIVPIRMEAENFKIDHRVGKNFELVFYRPGNYTFVGTRKDLTEPFFPDKIEVELERHSYHDSCWRTDGVDHVIRKFAKEIADNCKNEGKGYSVFTTFGITSSKIVNGIVNIHDFDSHFPSKFVPFSK